MSELILRRNDIYTSKQVGLEAPLLFSRSSLTLFYNDIESLITHIQANSAQQVLEQQVSYDKYDRATIPVWMVQGELDQGFFRGVLRPARHRHNTTMIAFSTINLEFRFYLEQFGYPELGVEVKSELIRFQDELRALTMETDKKLLPAEVTPYFDVSLNPSNTSLVIFKS